MDSPSYKHKSSSSPTMSSLSVPIDKEEPTTKNAPVVDDSGAANESTPAPLYHKPPPKQFMLILIA